MKKWLLKEYKKLLLQQHQIGEITYVTVKQLYSEFEAELADVGDFWPENSKRWTILSGDKL